MGFIPNKENILTYWNIICEASPRSEIFKYIFRRMSGKRMNFDTDVYITNKGGKLNCGTSMNNCTVACSQFEKELASTFKDIDTAVDIGANIGKHSIAIAQNSKRVVAVEPDATSFKLLSENVGINNLNDKIILVNKACGEKVGTVTFYRDEFYPTSNSITIKKNDRMTEEKVECDTVDNLCKDFKVDLIKVDVEGGELDVLKGSKQVITRCKPKIIFEAWDAKAADQIKEFLSAWGYTFTQLDEFNYYAVVNNNCDGEE